MKKVLIGFFLLIIFAFSVNSQTMLTIRQVYDFNVNDEFQYHWANIPPNADRIKIIEKYFSVLNDTVFYVRHFDNYFTQVHSAPWDLEYFFESYNDTVFFTNLDTLINLQFQDFPVDSSSGTWFYDTLYYTSEWCGQFIYEFARCQNCFFEGRYHKELYGEGLGLVAWIDQVNIFPQTDDQYWLRYYKKGMVECGTADTTTVSINENESNYKITISPNPFTTSTQINLPHTYHNIALAVYDILGKLLAQQQYTDCSQIQLNRNQLSNGLYFLKLTLDDKWVETGKVVVGE